MVRQEGYARLLRPGTLSQLLPMNTVAGVCLVVCFGALVIAYRQAIAGSSMDIVAEILAAFGSTLLLVVLTVITMDALIEPSALTDSQLSAGVQSSGGKVWLEMLSIPAICVATLLCNTACHVGVRASELVVNAWSQGTGSGPTVRELLGSRIIWWRLGGGWSRW